MTISMRLRRTRVLSGMFAAALLTTAGMPQQATAQGIRFIRDTEIEALLSEYAQPIFKAAGLGSQRIAMRIVMSDVFNAFVLDGRNVFMHTGALEQSETPNQVIGVIAHEAGHIAGGHLAQLRERIARDQTKSLLIKIFGIGAIIAGAATGSGGSSATSAGVGAIAGGDEILMRSILSDRRAQESAADQSGIRYLAATKQSGKGMLETFERFAQQEYISANGMSQDAFARSHPVAADRLAQLRDAVAKSPHMNIKDPAALQLRHDLMRAKIAGYLTPGKVFNRYPVADRSLPARYARTIARFFITGLESALPEVDALIRENPANPYFLEMKGDFQMRTGRSKEAVPLLRQAIKLHGGEAPLMTVRLAQALTNLDDPGLADEAIRLARQSLVIDPDSQAFRILANGYAKKGWTPQADLAIAEAHFLEGDLKQAQIFAKRSQRGLKEGSPESLRAGDIVSYKIPKG